MDWVLLFASLDHGNYLCSEKRESSPIARERMRERRKESVGANTRREMDGRQRAKVEHRAQHLSPSLHNHSEIHSKMTYGDCPSNAVFLCTLSHTLTDLTPSDFWRSSSSYQFWWHRSVAQFLSYCLAHIQRGKCVLIVPVPQVSSPTLADGAIFQQIPSNAPNNWGSTGSLPFSQRAT